MTSPPLDQCIVMPFRAGPGAPFNGAGLALHFLLGNVLVLHAGFKEMWFGWRVKRIFDRQAAFERYCRDHTVDVDPADLGRKQKVRFWITGICSDRSASLRFVDVAAPDAHAPVWDLPVSLDDRLVDFRARFIDRLAALGHAMHAGRIQAALWPESIDAAGLDAVGRALERFYIFSAYGGDVGLDLAPFERAAAEAPASFMAQDLYGWAHYRNRNYAAARAAFLTSLNINPAGAGAMSGLMWCGVYAKDIEEAMFWSGRKADVCGQDIEAAREEGRQRYRKVNG
ncbi:MAG TPA: hypothetical protein VLT88_09660 [Desulfosarcina sp.]|nr:hypothetical protein [Desulfosarcina sp.]